MEPARAQADFDIRQDPRFEKLLLEHHRLNRRIEELEQHLGMMNSSLSWRASAPLRLIRPVLGLMRSFFSFGHHRMQPRPVSDAATRGQNFISPEAHPCFVLASSLGRMPVGWVRLSLENRDDSPKEFTLYFDDGSGLNEENTCRFSLRASKSALVKLPLFVRGLRLDPVVSKNIEFSLTNIEVRECWTFAVLLQALRHPAEGSLLSRLTLGLRLRRIFGLFLQGGKRLITHEILGEHLPQRDYNRCYQEWIERYEIHDELGLRKLEHQAKELKLQPLLSLVMPVYNTPELWLRLAIDSIRKQTYRNWELCIADDASTRPNVKDILKEYQAQDSRIKVVFRTDNGHISESSNSALEITQGEFTVLMDHDDEIPPYALQEVVNAIQKNPEADLFYSDEDRLTKDGRRIDPYFKGDWDPELMRSQNVISHLGVYRTSIVREMGGFRKGFEGSQDWDFALRFIERTSADKIIHIPKILYHWRLIPGTVSFTLETKIDAFKAARRAVEESLSRKGIRAELKTLPESHRFKVEYPQIAPERKVLTCVLGEMSSSLGSDLEFLKTRLSLEIKNLSANSADYGTLLNQSVEESKPDFVVLLSGSLSNCRLEAMNELLAQANRPGIGAAGPIIWDKSGRLFHAGLICGLATNGENIPVSAHFGKERCTGNGYFEKLSLPRYVTALSDACLCFSADAWRKAGGFRSEGSSGAVVIDFCFRLESKTLPCLWTPHAEFTMNRSLTEVGTYTGQDIQLLEKDWANRIKSDKFFNPNLSRESSDFFLAFPPS